MIWESRQKNGKSGEIRKIPVHNQNDYIFLILFRKYL